MADLTAHLQKVHDDIILAFPGAKHNPFRDFSCSYACVNADAFTTYFRSHTMGQTLDEIRIGAVCRPELSEICIYYSRRAVESEESKWSRVIHKEFPDALDYTRREKYWSYAWDGSSPGAFCAFVRRSDWELTAYQVHKSPHRDGYQVFYSFREPEVKKAPAEEEVKQPTLRQEIEASPFHLMRELIISKIRKRPDTSYISLRDQLVSLHGHEGVRDWDKTINALCDTLNKDSYLETFNFRPVLNTDGRACEIMIARC